MIKLIFLVTLLLSGTNGLDYQKNAINVKGSASVLIDPDYSEFDLGIIVKSKSMDKAIKKIEVVTDSINNIFKKYGLNKDNAKIKNIQVGEDTEWDRNSKEELFVGYKARRFWEVKFTDLNKLSQFLFECNLAGANDLNALNFSHSKSDSINNSLIKKSIQNAKEIANLSAKSAGVKISKISVISDQPPQNYSYQNRVKFEMPNFGDLQDEMVTVSAVGRAEAELKFSSLFEIQPGKIEIEKSTWITFEIK